jgi:hypothetical protein
LYRLPIVVVAITPFIFVVTIELFSLKERVLELMMVVVPIEPARLEVRIFPEFDNVLRAFSEFKVKLPENKLTEVAFVNVEFKEEKLSFVIFSVTKFPIKEFVDVELVVVEFSEIKLIVSKNSEIRLNIYELVEVELVVVESPATKKFRTELPAKKFEVVELRIFEEVAKILVPVELLKVELSIKNKAEEPFTKFVVEANNIDEEANNKFELVANKLEEVELVTVALPEFIKVKLELSENKLEVVALVMVELAEVKKLRTELSA